MCIDCFVVDVDDWFICGYQGLQGVFNLFFMVIGGWVI